MKVAVIVLELFEDIHVIPDELYSIVSRKQPLMCSIRFVENAT